MSWRLLITRSVRRIGRVALIASLILADLPAPAIGAPTAGPGVPRKPPLPEQTVDRLILKFGDEQFVSALTLPELPTGLDVASQTLGVELDYVRQTGDGAHVLSLAEPVDAATAERLAAALEAYPNVAYAEPDYRVYPLLTPDDSYFAQQWSLLEPTASHYGINAPVAWQLTTGDPNMTIAVIDTGVLFDHPDLAGRLWPGYDFVSDTQYSADGDGRDPDPTDPGDWTDDTTCGLTWVGRNSSWHGTHVAGIIGAAGDNGVGIAGVNWRSHILPVRVLGRCGGSSSDIFDAVRWAAGLSVPGVPDNTHPARVINLSLGGVHACTAGYQSAVDDARAAGAVIVAAAGNSGADTAIVTPANCAGVIAVGATDSHGNLADYSNYGPTLSVSAPGGEMATPIDPGGVLSTYNNGAQTVGTMSYAYLQGTSMAAPHVTGVASLVLAEDPTLTPDQVAAILEGTVTAFPGASQCNSGCGALDLVPCTTELCGAGIVNAAAAVALAASLSYRQYLPVVALSDGMQAATLAGGGFEATKAGPWAASSRTGVDLVGPAPAGFAPHTGRGVAWLAGVDGEAAALERVIFVAADSPVLTFWHWIASAEPSPGADTARVFVDGHLVWQTDLRVSTTTPGWEQVRLDLSAYVGRTTTLRLEATTDGAELSSWLIDDVALTR